MSTWGTRSCLLREFRSSVAWRGAPWNFSHITAGLNRASSLVEVGTSGFLFISEIDVRDSVELKQRSQVSSCVEAWNFACLSSYSWGVRPLVELHLEPAAFLKDATRGSVPLVL